MILLQIIQETDSLAVQVVQGEKTIPISDLLTDSGTLWVIIPLAILSLVAVYIFVERLLAIGRASREAPNFMNQIKDHIYEGKIEAAKSLCQQTKGPYARMIEKGVSRIGKPLSDISAAVENVGKLQLYLLEKSLSTLATIAGAAPMLGFLGTVMGMIVTFHEIKSSGQAVKIEDLSGGIMQALVTTVAGLIIGIVAYVAYNFLVARVEKVVHKMESATIEFLDILQEPTK